MTVRKENINAMEIVRASLHTDPETYEYQLLLKLEDSNRLGLMFERDASFVTIQERAATVLESLEGD